ncbi:MAG: DUF4845 domain-containing protein [Gammaproteobacteria bacterium]
MHCVRATHARQRGLSMIGFLFVAVVLVFFAMLAMKLVPAYIEFASVKKVLSAMNQEGDLKSKGNAEIRSDFMKRANVSYVTVVKPEDLTIDRRGGVPVITVEYAFRTSLFGNLSLIADFKASSNPDAAPQIE